MTNRLLTGMLLAGGILTILSIDGWAQRGQGMGMGARQAGNQGACAPMLAALPKQDLTAAEAAGLLYLREEEKLARDVYTRLYAKWGARIFGNIARSEQRHFDALKALLDRYELADPAANDTAGLFTDPRLLKLYGEFIAEGEASLEGAFRVGATIEDLDIHDLEAALAGTDNDDLKFVYRNLQAASRNHIRAFVRQLTAAGQKYDAQFISAETLSEILASPRGAGRGGNGPRGFGRGNGTCPFAAPGNPPSPGRR